MEAIRLWAPNAGRLQVVAAGRTSALTPAGDGWWTGPALAPGTDYAFLLDDSDQPLPDPASRQQPYGVHGPSRVYDQAAYRWSDGAWAGRLLESAVIYELHLGTFTVGASLDSAIARLDHLVALGITHVELMPVNAVNGVWNWGYDGVGWYAVHEPYGGPDALKRFVDGCHARGLAVVLDVVYNHLGPSGDYLPRFGPYLKSGRNTWGALVNLEEPAVRRFILDNALMWLRDFHLDGLRLDAVHALQDSSPAHLLAELAAEVDTLAAELGRPLTLIAESDLNDPLMITPREAGGHGLAAQWDDDVHHALHAALTGERQGYYCDFGPLSVLAKVFTHAFLHDGTYSTFRGRRHGAPVDRERISGTQLVACLQNHDQVGNRPGGDRLVETLSPSLLRVGATLLLTAPFTPMLWMGEEWAAQTRWPFFTSHPEPDLALASGKKRLAEFADQWGYPRQEGGANGGPPADEGVARGGGERWEVDQMVDPQDPAAYHGAVLDWSELDDPAHASMLEFYRELIALRAAEPELRNGDLRRVRVDYDEDERWLVVHRGAFQAVANLSAEPRTIAVGAGTIALATGPAALNGRELTLAPEAAAIVRPLLAPLRSRP